ncbi:hypothetical protein EVAR_5355_1 [Eumeta japonica]|uniref:Uncharacterized protein n=1 Tax=Eumeta variegata TaxID=151549 RepID=A0A4C1TMC1_EUMVA|nr:hypothetical protein EVAR_5355_1 [Eumeta japonica]
MLGFHLNTSIKTSTQRLGTDVLLFSYDVQVIGSGQKSRIELGIGNNNVNQIGSSDFDFDSDLDWNHIGNEIRAGTEIERKKSIMNEIERGVLGIKKRDKTQLERTNEKTKFRKVQTVCRELKWQWTGHMLRERKEKWTKLITACHPGEVIEAREDKRNDGWTTRRR